MRSPTAFEWDDGKAASNKIKHDIDFDDVLLVFDGRPVLTRESRHKGKARLLTVAKLADEMGRWFGLGAAIALGSVSARSARAGEIRAHRAHNHR